MDVFLTHSSKDRKLAERVLAHVEAAGLRCGYSPRDLEKGREVGEAITEAVEALPVFVALPG